MSKWTKLFKDYKGTSSHSSFWADEYDVDYESPTFKSALSESQIGALKKYRLSSARKAISNFVTIATGKQIPVKFSTDRNSFTDGKTVFLSGDIDDTSKFDVGVGLALHEGSHVLLSDYDLLSSLYKYISPDLEKRAAAKGVYDCYSTLRDILNVVEDRRIDAFIYKNAPGYREYYRKLYAEYFDNPLVAEALESDEWKSETLQSYLCRLINIMNPASSLTALKGMRKIWSTLDLHNISRLKSTKDALDVSLQIFDIIIESLPSTLGQKQGDPSQSSNKDKGQSGQSQKGGDKSESDDQSGDSDDDSDGKSEDSSESESDGDTDSDESSDSSDADGKRGKAPDMGKQESGDDSSGGSSVDTDAEDATSGKQTDSSKPADNGKSLSENKKRKLQKLQKQQHDFLNGKVKKKSITVQVEKEIQSVESIGSELVHVGEDLRDSRGHLMKNGCEVVLIKQLTREMLERRDVATCTLNWNNELVPTLSSERMQEAERSGILLGKKLQVRNESRTTVFNRQRHGKIDKRLVHSLGFDSETVFTQMHIDKYKKANIHLTLDASGSMSGSKWEKTIMNAVSLAKAVSMIQNLSIQVSLRYGTGQLAYVVILYDSRKDSYQKVRSIFPYLSPTGNTPEGLTFEAMSKLMVPSSAEMDSYFVNISDGEPCFSNTKLDYSGRTAFDHTRKQVDAIRTKGITVISYFVDGSTGTRVRENAAFTSMYGKDSRFINITSINEVSKTMNKKFLEK